MIPCPFCKCKQFYYDTNQGTKWGFVVCVECGATGPEVRTGYNTSDNAEWHKDANKAWNTRTETEGVDREKYIDLLEKADVMARAMKKFQDELVLFSKAKG